MLHCCLYPLQIELYKPLCIGIHTVLWQNYIVPALVTRLEYLTIREVYIYNFSISWVQCKKGFISLNPLHIEQIVYLEILHIKLFSPAAFAKHSFWTRYSLCIVKNASQIFDFISECFVFGDLSSYLQLLLLWCCDLLYRTHYHTLSTDCYISHSLTKTFFNLSFKLHRTMSLCVRWWVECSLSDV